MDCIRGDATLGILGKGFHYLFAYARGGMESMVIDGKEWLYRVPKPTFWRATTDNDRGNNFSVKSGMWIAADMFLPCVDIAVYIDGEKIKIQPPFPQDGYMQKIEAATVKIVFTYETITVPATNVEVSYLVSEDGKIRVDVHYFGKAGLPQLPLFGMRFVMPTKAEAYRYQGLFGETYPDRMAGGETGIYQVEGLPVTPYLVPQDCGVHMNTEWVEIYRKTTLNNADKEETLFGLRFEGIPGEKDPCFAFSCLPYLAQELENATHQEELPLPRRTVVSILGAVRGVGGIDSWGADVEPAYQIDAQKDINYSFMITGAK